MTAPYISEIRAMAFGYAPRGWLLCNGQTLPIGQNQALFSLIGTTYGGDGIRTFMLPNLQGRVPMHFGNSFGLGTIVGNEMHTLSVGETPVHNHLMTANAGTPSTAIPSNTVFPAKGQTVATSGALAVNLYAPTGNNVAFDPSAIAFAGSSQPHENRQPYLTVSFCIAMNGVFPSRN